MAHEEEQIDPRKYTQKELIKKIYNDLEEIKTNQTKFIEASETRDKVHDEEIGQIKEWKTGVTMVLRFIAFVVPTVGAAVGYLIAKIFNQ